MTEVGDFIHPRKIPPVAVSLAHPAQEESIPQVFPNKYFFQKLVCVFQVQIAVGKPGPAVGQIIHENFALTEAHTAYLDKLSRNFLRLQKGSDLVQNFPGAVGQPAGSRADKEKNFIPSPARAG